MKALLLKCQNVPAICAFLTEAAAEGGSRTLGKAKTSETAVSEADFEKAIHVLGKSQCLRGVLSDSFGDVFFSPVASVGVHVCTCVCVNRLFFQDLDSPPRRSGTFLFNWRSAAPEC